MSIAYYMDVQIPAAITVQLRLHGIDVLTAQEDGTRQSSDPELLDRASALGRVIFSMDHDLLREAALRQRSGGSFPGVVYAHQIGVTIGRCVSDLELMAKTTAPEEWSNRVEYLPLA